MNIRIATDADRAFILGLSSTLAESAKLNWHSNETISQWQVRYIEEALDKSEALKITLIAETHGAPSGFIQVVECKDEISQETCARVPLLAVSKDAQARGVGRGLMEEAENWAKARGHRILQLEVFYNNDQARAFYEKNDYQNETIIMVKSLEG